ncbi:hypothetical protein BC941DRAFT_346103, partial [Chlamydoabsidia padenii]
MEQQTHQGTDTLNLRSNHLKLPTDIAPYLPPYTTLSHSLVSLDLSRNQLSNLPRALMDLVHLRKLNLAWNQFTQLPPVIHTLSQLEHLNITGNKLVDLYRLPVTLPHLQTLRANDNQLEQLDDQLGLWQNMVQLQLGNNKLAALVVDTMVDMVRLEELDLSHNQLHVWPSSLGLPALKHLNLADNRFTTLTPDLLYFPNLETLDMSSN